MAMAFDLLRKAKDKIVETVQVGLGTAPANDDEFQAYKKRLDRLTEMINVLRQNFQKYSETVVMMQKAACIVAKDVANFYKQSAPRQKTVQDFTDAHVTMESTVFDVFKNEFGWEILQAFDDWLSDIAKMRSNVKIAEETRQKVLSLGAKVKASEQRGDPDLGETREKLSQMAKKFSTMQTSLESGVAKMIEGRFASFDKMFVRLMECQVDFFRAGTKVVESLQPHVENFRTRFPRTSKGDYRPPTVSKADADEPHPNGDVDGDHVSDSGSDSDDHNANAAPSKSEEEPPVVKKGPRPPATKPAPSSGRKPEAAAKPAGLAGGAAASTASSSARSATPPASDNAGPVGGLDLFNGSTEMKKSTSQQFTKPKGANADFFQSMSQPDVDLMDGPAVAQSGSYAPPSMDFFSSEPSPSSISQKSAGRSSSPTPSKPSAIDPFDALNSFGAPAASPASSFGSSSRPAPINANAYSSKLPGNLQPPLRSSSGGNNPQGARAPGSASSSPKPLADDFGAFRSPQAPVSPSPSAGHNMGFDDLDPFGKSSGPSPAPAPEVKTSSRATASARRSAAPSPMPDPNGDGPVVVGGDSNTYWDGNRQPGEAAVKSAPNIKRKSAEEEAEEEELYQRTKKPGQTKEEWVVARKVRESQQQRAEQAAKEQKDRDSEQEAMMRLEDRLKAWELKNGVQRNLRNLLSSVHTILWPGIEWNPVSIADLTDAARVRKVYFKVVRVIHPDKLPLTASADQKVIAKKAYEAIQSAWKKFEEEGHA